MKITGDSIVDTVIDYSNIKFGVEMSIEEVSKQLKTMSFSDTLQLVDAIRNEDDDIFSDYIDLSAVTEAYGTTGSSAPSRATTRSQSGTVQSRRATISNQDAQRDGTGGNRQVAGGNKTATGTGANMGGGGSGDPDDMERQQNAQTAGQAANQSQQNSSEIERIKQLVDRLTRG